MKCTSFALQNARNNDLWRSVVKNVKDNYFYCCAMSSVTISYMEKLGTYEMCIFCDIK